MSFLSTLATAEAKAKATYLQHMRYPQGIGLGRVALKAAAYDAAGRAFLEAIRRATVKADAAGAGADFRALAAYLERPIQESAYDAATTPSAPGRRAARAAYGLVLDSSGVGMRATGRGALHSARDPRGPGDTYTGQGRTGRRGRGGAWTTLGAECPAAMILERIASAALEAAEAKAAEAEAVKGGIVKYGRALGRLARAEAKAAARGGHSAIQVETWRAGIVAAWRAEAEARTLAEGLPALPALKADARALKAEAHSIRTAARAWRKYAAADARAEYRSRTIGRGAWRALALALKADALPLALTDRTAARALALELGAATAARAKAAPAPSGLGPVPTIPAALKERAEALKARAAAILEAQAPARRAAVAAARTARAKATNAAPLTLKAKAERAAQLKAARAAWRTAYLEATTPEERAEAAEQLRRVNAAE